VKTREYRLGMISSVGYRGYVNEHASELGKSPYERARERDRHVTMARKFSIDGEHALWVSAHVPTIVMIDRSGRRPRRTPTCDGRRHCSLNRLTHPPRRRSAAIGTPTTCTARASRRSSCYARPSSRFSIAFPRK